MGKKSENLGRGRKLDKKKKTLKGKLLVKTKAWLKWR